MKLIPFETALGKIYINPHVVVAVENEGPKREDWTKIHFLNAMHSSVKGNREEVVKLLESAT